MRLLLKVFFIVVCVCLIVTNGAEALVRERQEYEKTGGVIWDVKTEDKVIALTFDDGPHPKYTAEILDILAENDAKATFLLSVLMWKNIQISSKGKSKKITR